MEIQDLIHDFLCKLENEGYEVEHRNTLNADTGDVVEMKFRVVGYYN